METKTSLSKRAYAPDQAFLPPVRSNQIARPRLIELLNAGLDKALILVSAPAGYGKTTLLSSWLRQTRISSAWLSLDKRDNDPIRFLQYFLSALHQIVPTIRLDLLGMLQGIQPPPYEALMSLVINEIDRNPVPASSFWTIFTSSMPNPFWRCSPFSWSTCHPRCTWCSCPAPTRLCRFLACASATSC